MAGPVRIAILANGAQARSEFTRTGTAMSKLGGFAKAGIVAAGVGLVALGKSAVSAEAEFSTSMRLIQAATKAPASEMGKLNDLAIKLGADTAFSASEAADAMLELAKAGIDTKTIMGGGLAGTLQLAAAGGTDLGTAATIASNALNTFGLRGRDMAKVAAALAGGANASSASVESLGQGLQQVGPGAINAGLSLQETVAALSAFDAAGVKGSDAGTSLKTMLTRLVPQTDKAANAMRENNLQFTKANGEFVSLSNIAGQLQRNLAGLSAKQRTVALNAIFGSDASRAATVLMKEGAEGVREFTRATNDQAAAQRMAEARMGGTAGALERLSGSVETAQLRLGQELAPAVEVSADFLAEKLVPAMDSAISVTKDVGSALKPVVNALGDLAGLAADAAGLIGDLPAPVKETAIQAGIAALVLPRLAGAAASAGGAFTVASAKVRQFNAEMTYAATRTQRVSAVTSRLGGAARSAAGIGGMVALAKGAGKADTALGALEVTAGAALLGFSVGGPWGAAIGAGAGGLYSLWKSMQKTSTQMVTAEERANKYADSIERIATASGKARRAEALALLQREDGLIPSATQLGIETNTLVHALLGNEKALHRVNSAWERNGGVLQGLENQKITEFLADQGFALKREEQELDNTREALRRYRGEHSKAPADVRKLNDALRAAGKVKPGVGEFERLFTLGMNRTGRSAEQGSERINRILRERTSRARPELGPFQQFLASGLSKARSDASLGGLHVGNALEDGTGKARANLSPFRSSLSGELSASRAMALSGGTSIGNALESGIVSGFASAASTLATNAANAVSAAIAAARGPRGADAHSPSRKMIALGKDMGDGLAIGMTGGSARSLLSIKTTRGSTSGAAAAQTAFPRELTLVVDGHPMRAIVRREMAADSRWRDRMDDRD